MRRCSFLILFLLHAFLAPARQLPDRVIASSLSQFQSADFGLPQKEAKDVLVIRATATINPIVKKLSGNALWQQSDSWKGTIHSHFVQALIPCDHSKNYLFHIYPSLHFW